MATILKEITQWDMPVANHTYKVSGAGKLLGQHSVDCREIGYCGAIVGRGGG